MPGAHFGPLMRVSVGEATPRRFDGPPRVLAPGFQIGDEQLVGPGKLFDALGFDQARRIASAVGDHLRRQGAFGPHRLPMDEMEFTTLPQVMAKLERRWKAVPN